jgi:beta-glucanase (GH16 family)
MVRAEFVLEGARKEFEAKESLTAPAPEAVVREFSMMQFPILMAWMAIAASAAAQGPVADGANTNSNPEAQPVGKRAIPAADQLIFDDEFDGTSLDLTKWYRCYPWADEDIGCTNRPPYDLEWYWDHNVSVSDGMLQLSAKKRKQQGYKYTSGMVVTGGSSTLPPGFTFLYGYMEMRAKFPPGKGMWPAFWLLPADGSWPPEIGATDWQGGTPAIDYATVHWGENNSSSGTSFDTGVDLSAGFHTYGVELAGRRCDLVLRWQSDQEVHENGHSFPAGRCMSWWTSPWADGVPFPTRTRISGQRCWWILCECGRTSHDPRMRKVVP